MTPVLSVAFVMALVAFAKERLKLKGAAVYVFAVAFAALVASFPLLIAQFPPAAPWLEALFQAVVLSLSAFGVYDLSVDIKNKASA